MDVGTDRATIVTIALASVFAFVVGAVAGLVTTFTYRGLPPWGLLAGLAIVAALVVGFRLVFGTRIIAAAAALGFVAAIAALTLPGAGGIAFVLDDPIDYVWAAGPVGIAAVAIGWPSAGARRNRSAGRSTLEP